MSVVLDRQLVVRVPRWLLDALRDDADENGRTVAQSARHHLRKALTTTTTEGETP